MPNPRKRRRKARRPVAVRHARRVRERENRARKRTVEVDAIRKAGGLMRPVIGLANALDRSDAKGLVRWSRVMYRMWEGDDAPPPARIAIRGATKARRLLETWRPREVARLIKGVEVEAEYYLTPDGTVDIGTNYSTGSLEALVALSIGYARDALRGVDEFDHRVKRCATPSCAKWFFDGKRGTRKFCCSDCENVHKHRRGTDYPSKQCERCD